jgi:hypothetical protein
MWWVVSTTVRPSAAMARSRSHRFRLACGSSDPGGLVEEQHGGPVHRRAGDGQPLCLAARQLLGPGARHPRQPDRLVGPLRRHPVEGGERAQLLPGRQAFEERGRLELDADLRQQRRVPGPRRHAEHAHLAAVRLAQALDHLERGGLARSIRPENPEELPFVDLKAHAVNGAQVAIGLPHIPDRYGSGHGRHTNIPTPEPEPPKAASKVKPSCAVSSRRAAGATLRQLVAFGFF